jgi:cephalosporin-C deacetylase-like acetyl esterase
MAKGETVTGYITRHNAELAAQAVPEWRATLNALQDVDGLGGPVGFWGLSLGTGIGVPLIAGEPRIKAAVLGLLDYPSLSTWASKVTVPVEFLLQWDDELVSRVSCFALFEALGSTEKTLHANPGGHLAVPAFELDSAERFFLRHLVG